MKKRIAYTCLYTLTRSWDEHTANEEYAKYKIEEFFNQYPDNADDIILDTSDQFNTKLIWGTNPVYSLEINWISKTVILRADCLSIEMRDFLDTLCDTLGVDRF